MRIHQSNTLAEYSLVPLNLYSGYANVLASLFGISICHIHHESSSERPKQRHLLRWRRDKRFEGSGEAEYHVNCAYIYGSDVFKRTGTYSIRGDEASLSDRAGNRTSHPGSYQEWIS